MKTKLVAIMLSLAIVSNTALGAYTMTTPAFNSLVPTTGFTIGGSRGGGAAVALTAKVKNGSGGIVGVATATAAPGGMWTGFASPTPATIWTSPGFLLQPVLYDATGTIFLVDTYCHLTSRVEMRIFA